MKRVNYVSLGDSIATGTITPFSNIRSFVYYLHERFGEADVYNLARNGDTAGDLLCKIDNSCRFRRAIENADFITVSIGGNDLMKAASLPGFVRIDEHRASYGVKSFAANWPLIIDEIRSINRGAEIVVLNLFNPYNRSEYLERRYCGDNGLYETADKFIAQINGVIKAYSANKYEIADVYSEFERFSKGDMDRVSCLYQCSMMQMLRNPHPTPEGQRIIADAVIKCRG